MALTDLTTKELAQRAGVKTEIDKNLVEYIYANCTLPECLKGSENYERMISGMPYDAFEPNLEVERMKVRDLTYDYGAIRMKNFDNKVKDYYNAREAHIRTILGFAGKSPFMEYPFYFDYGFNTAVGNNFYSNYDLKILDVAPVIIGNNVMCGTGVSILTATHPTDPNLRCNGIEMGLAINIEDNVWLGANSVILAGVKIGKFSVIAAGSVVNKDIPPYSVVVGVPGRVVKTLDPFDEDYDAQAGLAKHGLDYLKK